MRVRDPRWSESEISLRRSRERERERDWGRDKRREIARQNERHIDKERREGEREREREREAELRTVEGLLLKVTRVEHFDEPGDVRVVVLRQDLQCRRG